MNMLMVLEIVVGVIVLAAVVRFAARDVRQRGVDGLQQHSEPERTLPVAERPSEPEAEEHPSEVADRA